MSEAGARSPLHSELGYGERGRTTLGRDPVNDRIGIEPNP